MKYFIALMFVVLGLVFFGEAHAASDSKVVVIDVRTPEEYSGGHVEGALNIDVQADGFAEKIGKLDKSKTYKLYCRSGKRSGRALEVMKGLGFGDVENVGGYQDAKGKLEKKVK